MPFDPKDLWPIDAPFIAFVPLWVGLSLGALAMIFDWMLVTWVGLTALVLGPAQRGAGWKHRVVSGLIGVALVVSALTTSRIGMLLSPDRGIGLAPAALGSIATIIGVSVRGVSGRVRATIVLIGLIAIAIFAWHHTPIGLAMLSWYMD